jgi:hypothetical protein
MKDIQIVLFGLFAGFLLVLCIHILPEILLKIREYLKGESK